MQTPHQHMINAFRIAQARVRELISAIRASVERLFQAQTEAPCDAAWTAVHRPMK